MVYAPTPPGGHAAACPPSFDDTPTCAPIITVVPSQDYGRGMPSPLRIPHHPPTHHGRARGSALLHGNLRPPRDFVRISIDLRYARLYVGTRPFKLTCHAGSRVAFSNMQQSRARLLPHVTPATPAARLNVVPGVPAGASRPSHDELRHALDMEVSRW